MKNKQDNSEDMEDEGKKKAYNGDEEMPEEDKKKDASIEKRMSSVEKTVDNIHKKLDAILSSVSKEEEDMPEEDKKKDDEEMPDEDKKKDEHMPKEEDKKKDDEEPEEEMKKEEGEPKPGESEVKIPQAPAGETDETDQPETDRVDMLEKKLSEVSKKLSGILKGRNLVKSTTPRAAHEIAKRSEGEKPNLAMDIIKGVRSGKMSIADSNRKVKYDIIKNDDEKLKALFESKRAERGG